jgi:hypothetical protein
MEGQMMLVANQQVRATPESAGCQFWRYRRGAPDPDRRTYSAL